MTTRVEPFGDRILVRPIPESDRTKGGIVIPENAKEKPTTGTILAVGPGKRDNNGVVHEVVAQVGDTVVYSKYAGIEIRVNDEDAVLLRETDLLTKLLED